MTAVSNRQGTPDDIARGTVFLASEDSSYANGTELFVDEPSPIVTAKRGNDCLVRHITVRTEEYTDV